MPYFSSENVKWDASGRLNMAAIREYQIKVLLHERDNLFCIANAGLLPIMFFEMSRSDQILGSSILTFTMLVCPSLSRGSSRSASTELK